MRTLILLTSITISLNSFAGKAKVICGKSKIGKSYKAKLEEAIKGLDTKLQELGDGVIHINPMKRQNHKNELNKIRFCTTVIYE